ncbi:hypothetical protein [Micromonospora sp. DT47]
MAVGAVLIFATDGAYPVGTMAVMLASVCSIVAGIGASVRDARRK